MLDLFCSMRMTRWFIVRNAIFFGVILFPFAFLSLIDSQRKVVSCNGPGLCIEDRFSHPVFQFLYEPTEQMTEVFYQPIDIVFSFIPRNLIRAVQATVPRSFWMPVFLIAIGLMYLIPLNILCFVIKRIFNK